MELRSIISRNRHCKVRIGIEMVVVVKVRTIIMVTIRYHNRHLHNNRFDRFLKPAFPLPFRVGRFTSLYEVTREEAETSIRHRSRSCSSAPFGILHVLGILNMAVGHVEEGIFALCHVLRTEMRNRAPVTRITYTPAIRCTRLQILRHCFMANIFESCLGIHLGCLQQTRSGNGIAQRLGSRCFRIQRNNTFSCLEVSSDSFLFCDNLYDTVCNAFIGKPCERHVGTRITIDIGNHVIRLRLRYQFNCGSIHFFNLSGNRCNLFRRCGETIDTRCLFCHPERDKRRYGIIFHSVYCISC